MRYLALTDILGKTESSTEVRAAKKQISRGPRLRALLSGQRADGGFGTHWYKKWAGATWRLVSAVELGVPPRMGSPGERRTTYSLDFPGTGPNPAGSTDDFDFTPP